MVQTYWLWGRPDQQILRLGGLGARMQNAVKLGVWRVITLQPGGVGRGVATAKPDLYNMYVNIYIIYTRDFDSFRT